MFCVHGCIIELYVNVKYNIFDYYHSMKFLQVYFTDIVFASENYSVFVAKLHAATSHTHYYYVFLSYNVMHCPIRFMSVLI